MKICISSSGKELNADIDPRFGRAMNFIIIDTDTMDYEAIENPAMSAGGGAGTQASQLVISKGAQAVLTGNVGPNAFNALNSAGVKIYVGVSGNIKDAVEKFKKNELNPIDDASVGAHYGSGGRGMGRGRNR